MAITIAICELEAPNAACRKLKTEYVRASVDNPSDYFERAETDLVVPRSVAEPLIGDWSDFVKRNGLDEESEEIYVSFLRNKDDASVLGPLAQKKPSGWISLKGMDAGEISSIASKVGRDRLMSGWEMLTFDEMKEACLSCPLSWDKGRGCIGAFGPDNSLLPEIAKKHGCEIVASVPEGAKSGRIYTPADGAKLAKEVVVLEAALPAEGKVYVNRYSGPVERLTAVARISMEEGCGFFFM